MKKHRVDGDFSIFVNKPLIQKGDKLRTPKGREFEITEIFSYMGRKIYKTDKFGLFFENDFKRGKCPCCGGSGKVEIEFQLFEGFYTADCPACKGRDAR